MTNLNQANRDTLLQISTLLKDLSDEQFKQELIIFRGGSIGKHVRHIIEFYQCALDLGNGKVNYDARKRNTELENNRSFAIEEIHNITSIIEATKEDRSLTLCLDYGLDAALETEISSTLYRELAYNLEHCVHHMAIIRMGVESFLPDYEFPEDFGVARSTIRNQREQEGIKSAS